MTGILPLVTATAVGLFAMQPRTVWRQGGMSASGAKTLRVAEPTATQPVGGVIDDPLPREYERSGRALPGPIPRPASPVGGNGLQRREAATAGLRDVIPTVRRAAASKPVDSPKPRRLASPPRYEADDPVPTDGAKEPDEPNGSEMPKGPTLGSANLEKHPKEQERQEEPIAKTKFTARPSTRDRSASMTKNEESKKSKNPKSIKKATTSGEPSSPSDRPPAGSRASSVPSGALVGLFASLGANVFLLWVAASQRHRFRALVREMFEGDRAAHHADDADGRDDLPHWEAVDEDSEDPSATRAGRADIAR